MVELSLIVERAVSFPYLQNCIEDLSSPGVSLVSVDSEEFELGGYSRRCRRRR